MIRIDRYAPNQLHSAFLEAFADYAMDASGVTEASLRLRGVKNGVDDELSVGAFDGEKMVGFTLIGVGPWEGKLAAFDAGTGIVREHRGGGLAGQMFDHALPALRARGVSRFLLEVLKDNDPAIRAYEKTGFGITREFVCLRLERPNAVPARPAPAGIDIREIYKETVLGMSDCADWTPSWENSFAAIERIPEQLLLRGAFAGDRCVGAVAYSPTFRWVLSLLVERGYRREGIASALLGELIQALPSETEAISVTNIEAKDEAMIACFGQTGFAPWARQYEMALTL